MVQSVKQYTDLPDPALCAPYRFTMHVIRAARFTHVRKVWPSMRQFSQAYKVFLKVFHVEE